MDKNEIDFLVTQIQRIILGKPLLDLFSDDISPEFLKLQESISYLSSCLTEANNFVYSLCNGKLEVEAPSRYNFLAGNLKELHSILKFLTWQTVQVANGDYHQKVDFLGEFSDSFNLLIKQLEEREIGLNEKTKELSQSMDLLVSVMDTQKDGILVIDVVTQEVIYSNQSIQQHFYNPQKKQSFCKKLCPLFEYLKSMKTMDQPIKHEYYCKHILRYFAITSSSVNWGGQKAIVHYLSDVSAEKEKTNNLFTLAYQDDLTGLYNRRYCIETLMKLLDTLDCFSLVMLDLDRLKYVNDHFGHLSGDEYICTVVAIINEHTSDTDVLCRIGGDEFVIIFQNHPENFVLTKMKEIHSSVLQIKRNYPLSFSYGITHVSGGQYHSTEEILNLSDSRMYEFKNNHRLSNDIPVSLQLDEDETPTGK